MSLRDYINNARTETYKPIQKRRTDWGETEHRIALDLRLTGTEAGKLLGCTGQTVNAERREWTFE